MVLKKYLTISILIIVCFLSAFFLLFNGFFSIVQAERNVKKEIRYGYQNEVRMYIESIEDMNISNLLILEDQIEKCNVYIDNLCIYFTECAHVFCPEVLLCQNEQLPYPTIKGSSKIPQKGILVSDNIEIKGDELSIHGCVFKIFDKIDTEQYEGLKDYFVLTGEDYFQVFEEGNMTKTIELRICSNKVDIYETYIKLKSMIQEIYPKSYIRYVEGERNSNIFTGLFSGKAILGMLLYLFALINVMIISFYWISVRKREIGIRKAYGATNQEIIFLLLKEMLFIITISAILAFGIQVIIQMVIRNGMVLSEWMKIALFYLGTIMVAALVAIVVPVRYILRIHPAEGIK